MRPEKEIEEKEARLQEFTDKKNLEKYVEERVQASRQRQRREKKKAKKWQEKNRRLEQQQATEPLRNRHKTQPGEARSVSTEKRDAVLHLMSTEKPANVKRLMWLLDALRRAEKLRKELFELKAYKDARPYGSLSLLGRDPVPEIKRLDLELHGLLGEIAGKLKRYHRTTTIHVIEPEYYSLVKSEHSTKKADQREALGALYLVEFASNGSGRFEADICKFRNCYIESCGKLFCAATESQRFCSDSCRKKFYTGNDEYKAKRAAHVREERRKLRDRTQAEDLTRQLAELRNSKSSIKRRIQ